MANQQERFRELISRHREVLFRHAQYLASSPSFADDLVQDTAERALRAFPRFSNGGNARGWLIAIMNNLFIDSCRHRARDRSVGPARLETLSAGEPAEVARWRTIASEQLQAVVPLLDPQARELITLYLSGVRSYRGLSARLGIPERTVGTRLHRARRKLRVLLEERWPRIEVVFAWR
jgi:RNA polymerase sigma-70 factor (ECF subfamily)